KELTARTAPSTALFRCGSRRSGSDAIIRYSVLASEFAADVAVPLADSVVAASVLASELVLAAVLEPVLPQPARLRTMPAASTDAMSFFIFFPPRYLLKPPGWRPPLFRNLQSRCSA